MGQQRQGALGEAIEMDRSGSERSVVGSVTPNQLDELIAIGENSGVEFKPDDCRPRELLRDVVALANLRGGVILLGVEDDGTVSGIRRPKLEEWVMNLVVGKIHPAILPFYEEVPHATGRRVAVLSFPAGSSKPYVLRHGGKEEIYVRVGSTSRLATREQQATLFASGGLLHPEVLPVAGTSMASLDRQRLHDYLSRVLRDPEVPSDDSGWESRLEGLGFLVESGGRLLATIAGLLLFGISPRRYLRHAGVRLMVFEGDDVDSRALLDETLDGALPGLWRPDESGSPRLAQQDHGLIERLASRLEPYITRESGVNGQFRRDRELLYPLEAVRELAVNAVVHRDWTRAIETEIRVFSHRLEVLSPGGLHNSMTVSKMIAGQRFPRNPLLVEALRDYGYVDARGMGVRAKVIPLARKLLGTEPIFEATEDYLRTSLHLTNPHTPPSE